MEITSIILAGGKNLRLGRSKALEVINGKSLVERVLDRLQPLSSQILVVTSRERFDLPGNYRAEMLADVYPDRGPLGGLYTGLTASHSPTNIVVACDMPFLNTELLNYMVGLSGDFDAVVPRVEKGMIEPLHAVYSRDCVSTIGKQMENNHLSIHAFLDKVRVRYMERTESEKLDPQLLSFFNINYQSDLDRAIDLVDRYGI
jgi:molybdopterin-guanine dinucleotide biosynthesis protein A